MPVLPPFCHSEIYAAFFSISLSDQKIYSAAGKLFSLLVAFSLNLSGQHGTRQLNIVLSPISNILSFHLYDLSIDTWVMLQFLMRLVLFGIADSYLSLLQQPLSKLAYTSAESAHVGLDHVGHHLFALFPFLSFFWEGGGVSN